jgi:predicted dehydrogenase
MNKTYKWGILGVARIAGKFAKGLKVLPNAECYAIASRSLERAEAFREKHGFAKAYGSYEEMVADPEIDVVYIATTNNLHFEHTMLCLEAGKAVLCEKPFASDLSQVEQMVNKSREKNVFLMEALWSRFVPSMMQFKAQVESGAIKRPLLLQCNFGFISPFDPHNRIYDPALGGGSIPDIGIYPIFTAMYLFGKPESIEVMSVPCPTGTDWTSSILFKHKKKEISMLTSSFEMILDNEARVYGEGGYLKLHSMFHMPARLTLRTNDGHETDIPLTHTGNGYNYEAAEVMDCLDSGLIESPGMSHAFSIELMQVLDEVSRKAKKSF